jgi:hypothetical protein
MTARPKPQAQMIAPDDYPQMMTGKDVAHAMATLRSAQTRAKAQGALQSATPAMRAAILQFIDQLEDADQDLGRIFDLMHEIRGFAETAGLLTTGRIADILCRYMDDMLRLGKVMDAHLVALHVAAITRAARAEKDDEVVGEVVATELAALVTRRLVEAQSAPNS